MDFLSLLVHLKEVCLKIVFTWLGHIDLDSSAENNLASMEGLDDLKEVISRNFEHGIGSACLGVRVGCNLSILGLHGLNYIGELHVEGARC